MGTWLNVAFIQSADIARVERELSRLLVEAGRRLTTPRPRTPERSDRMQYGLGDEVQRWGLAGFHGAPGWTVLRTAPFELLMQGTPPLLARLSSRLGVPAFQYNIYDSTPAFLMEVDAAGRVELSGFVGSDVMRYWNGEPPMERSWTRFHLIDPTAVAAWAESAMPEARVTEWISPSSANPPRTEFDKFFESQQADLAQWLGQVGTRIAPGSQEWSVHPAHIVRRLAQAGSTFLSADECVEPAIKTVFGGPNAEHCDNLFLVETLVPHAPMPVDGFVLYAEAGNP
ncbi:hypothetical protein D7V97_38600 [Corallococcus sp. CA053C]|uniref:hypothetical protein n=1 Tax=Corallococcus sp. CA053C TaxID=2316732 RepID=UPI000EA13BAA|nr:hypothetical protein [Corallococcus sp. CA053C]RKG94587.1 hypothetical protein D7V97_38600 [Corallococcus sp. CA053C]